MRQRSNRCPTAVSVSGSYWAARWRCKPLQSFTAVQNYVSPGAVDNCQELVAPEITQACFLTLDPLPHSRVSAEPTHLVIVTGTNLAAATLHAHAAGQHLQLHSGADGQFSVGLAGFSKVLLFVSPAELLKEEQIVLEACWEGAWSHPVELPSLAAMAPDNFDSIMAACPAVARQELEERLSGLVASKLNNGTMQARLQQGGVTQATDEWCSRNEGEEGNGQQLPHEEHQQDPGPEPEWV
ncbi:hypothetical protein WJX74_002696 [Apatococcus lobatus]|uniref:Uncharacterized protein n=2 Tax=Apatococcus TaxID=904362 RepID=A0AAW1S821_9CHLO